MNASSNRTGEQIDTAPVGANYNRLNQLINQIGNGMTQFSGNISKTGAVSVAGNSASMTNQTNFSRLVTTQPGTNANDYFRSNAENSEANTRTPRLGNDSAMISPIAKDASVSASSASGGHLCSLRVADALTLAGQSAMTWPNTWGGFKTTGDWFDSLAPAACPQKRNFMLDPVLKDHNQSKRQATIRELTMANINFTL